jgi:hypothetical protein
MKKFEAHIGKSNGWWLGDIRALGTEEWTKVTSTRSRDDIVANITKAAGAEAIIIVKEF